MKPQPRYQPGDKIGGRYLVHQALMGGMGEVYLCLDLKTTQPYALKTFQQSYLTDLKLRKAFESEAAVWVALERHPNIVRCYFVEILDNQPFMVLDWVASDESRSTDLRGWLRHGPLNPRLGLDFIIDICRGLIHAQQRQPGIVHRDLKPENILVGQGRLAKITDWGLAKIVETAGLDVTGIESKTGERQSLWGQGAIVGTPPYMAPEQWRGEALDARVDIYAIGCILHEMLTGNPPFQARTLDGLRRQHLESDIPKLVDGQARPDSQMNTLLVRCLAKRREERFAAATDLLQQMIFIYEQRFAESPKTAIFLGGNEFTAADYNNRGATYHALRRYEEALADCDRAIQLDPSFANAYVNRGVTRRSLHQDQKALADFNRAIQLDSTMAMAYGNRGVVYHAQRRYDDALVEYNRAIQLDPTLAGVYVNRAITHESLQRFDEALADYNRAVQLNQDLAEAYANRCATFGAMNRFAEALSDANHAIRLNPTLSKAYMNRAVVYVMLNRFDEALADFARAVELDPDDPEVYYNRAKLHEILQRFDKALSDYDHAIQIDPNYSWAYNSRGHVHSLLNHNDRALSDFTRAIETDPSHVLAYTNRGTLYLQLHQYEKALSDFTRAIQIDPTNSGAYTNRGAAYYQAGRSDEAFSDWKKATELDPSNALAYRNMGVLANERGTPQEALRYFEKAAQLGDAEAVEHVARARSKKAKTMSAPRDNLARMIRRLKSDGKFCQLFRSDPVRAVMEYELTIGEALELMASSDLPSGTIQDMEARLRLLKFIASYGDKK